MISKDATIPEVVTLHPGTRAVFDRYGLHGCGGPSGPPETLEFFARVHGVPIDRLLADLDAARHAPAAASPYREELGDVLYRRFFRAAIAVLLTAGAGLGVLSLLFASLRGSLLSLAWLGAVQAHASAQVFGWIGLFVMGFALQGLPRFKYVRLWRPDLANLSFLGMVAGVALRTLGAVPGNAPRWAGLAGALGIAGSASLFVFVLSRTLAASETRDAWDKWVGAGIGAFLFAALLEPIYFAAVAFAPISETALLRVARFAGPTRDLQLLGFGGLVALGIGQRVLPTAFGFRAVGPRAADRSFALVLGGLLAGIGGALAFTATREPALAVASSAGAVFFAAGAISLAWGLCGSGAGEPGRSRKLLRAALAWLAIACVLRAAEPIFLRATGQTFSHAYAGAWRHAFGMGFLSMLILGVSAKVVPVLQGLDASRLPSLRLPFFLLQAGTAIRVAAEIGTDLAPRISFPLLAASGPLAAAGFFLWGVHLWRLLGKGAGRPAAEPSSARPGRIEGGMRPADVVRWFPGTLEVFEAFGLRELRNPVLRNTLGRRITLAGACSMKGVDLARLLAALNEKTLR